MIKARCRKHVQAEAGPNRPAGRWRALTTHLRSCADSREDSPPHGTRWRLLRWR
jgi:hypothetical protein